MKLMLPAFLPDRGEAGGGLVEMRGAVPFAVSEAGTSYEPVKEFRSISEALPAAFYGGASFIDDAGTSTLLTGTANGLVKYAAGAWSDLFVGMSVTEQWRFASFGNFAVAVNGQSTKVVDLGTATASTLAGAPAGKSVAIVGDYVVIGQGAGDLLGVYTSKINDHTGWDVNDGATVQPMLAGGEVMGLAGGEYGVILQRRRIVRMSPTGDATAPFSYEPVAEDVGCASRASVAAYGRTVFFLSDSGFMALDHGQALRPIGNQQVDDAFKAEVAPENYERMFAAVDPQKKLVIWCVPGTPGRLWIYNYALDRWATETITVDGVFNGFTSSTSMDALGETYATTDAIPFSLEDPRWSGGAPQFYVVQERVVGSLSGNNRAAVFQTGFVEPIEGRVTRYRAVRPLSDGIDGDIVTLDVRARQGDEPNKVVSGSMRRSGIMPVRASGRYCRVRWEKEAGFRWSYANGFEIEAEAGGAR